MRFINCILVLFTVLFSASTLASPISLSYATTPTVGGKYHYDFTLTLDNKDKTWSQGQGWGWFIFGDAAGKQSPIADFVMDAGEFPVGPWTSLTMSGGGHNGPTFNSVMSQWTPKAVGESLQWAGSSKTDLMQGELLFTSLFSNARVQTSFEVAQRVNTRVPEPASIVLLAIGLAGLCFMRRRA